MSINVSQSFHRTSSNAVDDTLTLTKAEMLAINDNLMPSKYLTVCQDDGYIYLYDKSATPDAQTGKFSKFEGGGQVDTSKLYSTDDSASTDIADGDYFPFYDTSATAKKNSLWSNIKSTLKTYFDTLYQGTLTAGTNISISGSTINASMPVLGTINRSDILSTTEKIVGCNTDGRPIYQKTVSIGALPNNTTKYVAHNISNLREVTEISGIGYNSSTGQYCNIPIPFYCSSTLTYYDVFIAVTTTNIEIYTARDWSSLATCYVTVRYTKTTDSANSYNYASENDYSTSEHIIGTWTGGQTLYQRTYTGTTSSSTYTNAQIASLGSSWTVRELDGFVTGSNGISCPVNCVYPDTSFNYMVCCYVDASKKIQIRTNHALFLNQSCSVTVKYTK